MSEIPKLPWELIFHIIDSLLAGEPSTILRPSGSTTKTLLSLTRVCRAIYPMASNHLRQHCIYIDNDRRLRDLIWCVESTSGVTQRSKGRHADPVAPVSLSQPPSTTLCPVTSLYIAPFCDTIDNLPTAIWLRELFCLIHPTLRRLIIDMPLRSIYPADDHLDVRRTLRGAFSLLKNLEEFSSVRDELYLDVLEPEWRTEREPAVWRLWPRLRRLALYNVTADEFFWASIREMHDLEIVVLTRAEDLQSVCIKSNFLGVSPTAASTAGEDGSLHEAEMQNEHTTRPLKVVLVATINQQPTRLAGIWKWDEVDPGNMVKVMLYDVPTSSSGQEDPWTVCRQWVKTACLRGEIWEWEGRLVQAEQGEDSSRAQSV